MSEALIFEERTDGVIIINGREFMIDATGGYVPVSVVKDEDKLMDQAVRKIIGYAKDLSAQIDRFREHTMEDLATLDALLAEKYNTKVGGKKGNRTYRTFDGLLTVNVQVAQLTTFGPQLQIAKTLIDECLNEWSAESRPEIQLVVTRAFNTDQEGKVNKNELYKLLRHKIEDDRWQRAMQAIRDAITVIGSKEYVRFYEKADEQSRPTAITIDLAKAGA